MKDDRTQLNAQQQQQQLLANSYGQTQSLNGQINEANTNRLLGVTNQGVQDVYGGLSGAAQGNSVATSGATSNASTSSSGSGSADDDIIGSFTG